MELYRNSLASSYTILIGSFELNELKLRPFALNYCILQHSHFVLALVLAAKKCETQTNAINSMRINLDDITTLNYTLFILFFSLSLSVDPFSDGLSCYVDLVWISFYSTLAK